MKRKLVQALAIDYDYIYTLCCSKYCKHHIHKYGSAGDLSDRMEYRCSHCRFDRCEIKIRIDETTKRCKVNYYKNKSITLSTRALKYQRLKIEKKNKDKSIVIDSEDLNMSPTNHLTVRFD
jgi:hypothetical protein